MKPALHLAETLLRTILALLLTLLLSPLLAPALLPTPPAILPFHLLHILAATLLSLLSHLARIDLDIKPRTPLPQQQHTNPLPMPLLRSWTSPLPPRTIPRNRPTTLSPPPSSHCTIVAYDQPGRWMTAQQLQSLRQTLRQIAHASIGTLPTHALFHDTQSHSAFSNRVIAIVYDHNGPVGFTAMVYLPVTDGIVVHLGLTMIAKRARGQRLQPSLLSRVLLLPIVNLCTLRYTVTNVAASPSGIGNFCDYFVQTFPHYKRTPPRTEWHLRVAREVLTRYRHEFGCSERATFDQVSFVVYGSNEREGGGTFEFVRKDGSAVSRHRDDACNRFVEGLLDFAQGDELFQVGVMDVFGTACNYIKHAARRKAAAAGRQRNKM